MASLLAVLIFSLFGLVYRMEGVYRLLLHERKLMQDVTSDAKFHAPIQYERDVFTALGTTKWQVQTVKFSI
jgi:hypothetical protein